MKILLVSALQIYPVRSGGQSRTASLAQALASHGHDVTLFSLIGRRKDLFQSGAGWNRAASVGVAEYVARPWLVTLVGLASFKIGLFPLWATIWLFFRKFRDPVLRELLEQSQVVIADFPFTFPVIPSGPGKPVSSAVDDHSRRTFVLNTHNIEHHVVAAPFQRTWVKRIEDLAAKRAQLVVACSQSDAAYFRPHARESVLVVPNGIDLSRIAIAADERASLRDGLRAQLGVSQQTVILFSASSYGPNRVGFEFLKQFCLTNQQLLLRRSVTFLVVGSVSSHAMVLPGIIVTGKVDRVEPYFYASDLAVNPIFEGGGTSVKVAEYLAAGLPMLTTRVGSRGYALEDGTSCFIFCQDTLREKLEHMLDHRDVVSLADEALSKNRQFIDMKFAIAPLVERMAALAEPALSP